MSSWAEIRRLQAALDEVQASSTSHKLSERNCIEVVSKLVEMGLVSVLYTLDGKEYVVTSYLETEIRNELQAHRGRINTVDLQQILNVDLVHIQKGVDSIIRSDPTLELIQGELISSLYKETFCTEVNEQLLQNGHVSLADLSTSFGLPLSYITPCIESSLGVLIKGHLDKSGSGLLYTESYVSRHKARIRGTFSAVTRPTPVGPILLQGNYNENLFHTILHELVSSGQLSGSVHGRSDQAIYIPSIFTDMQNQWIDNFLSANGYLEYDAVKRLGIEDPLKFIKQRYKSHDLLMLDSCCLGPGVISEVDGCVQEEVQRMEKWVDIMPLLPTPCSSEDASVLLQSKYSDDQLLRVFGSVLAHVKFIRGCQDFFKPLLTERAAKAAVSSGSFLKQVSREPEGVAEEMGTKKGGKQKKGKGRRGKERDEEGTAAATWEVKFMSIKEIVQVLREKMDDLSEEFATALADVLSRPLQQLFQEEAKQLLAQQSEGEADLQRKRHTALTQQVQELWNRARLFEKGTELFEGDTKFQLVKYLLKTLCTDMTNNVVTYVATDHSLKVPEDTPTLNKDRVRIIKNLPEPVKQLALNVNTCLNGKEVHEFFEKFEKLCVHDNCGMMLKKLDKKKEKQLLFSHQHSLMESLKEETDPAMALHLAVAILFQQINGCPIHMPGRLLPFVLTQLRGGMDPGDFFLLTQFQDMVVARLKDSSVKQKLDEQSESVPASRESSEESKNSKSPPPSEEDNSENRKETSSVSDNKTEEEQATPSSVERVQDTPSPVHGEWEMVKSYHSELEAEVVRSETTKESLKLLEEVLEERRDTEGVPGHETGCAEDKGNAPSDKKDNGKESSETELKNETINEESQGSGEREVTLEEAKSEIVEGSGKEEQEVSVGGVEGSKEEEFGQKGTESSDEGSGSAANIVDVTTRLETLMKDVKELVLRKKKQKPLKHDN